MAVKPRGLIVEPFQPEDYLGGTSQSLEAKYGGTVINPSGDWSNYLPSTEDQDTSDGDTWACASFGTSNAVEILARFTFKESIDLSDRFLAKTSGTLPGKGNSPIKVADTLRHSWSVKEPEWPDTNTVEEYYAEIPANLKTLAVARGAEFEFGYQYVPNNPASIKAHLQTSPLGIAVTAWQADAQGVYQRIAGMAENHWPVLIKVLDNGNYKVFDSFPPFIKEVHPSAAQSIAMSYYLNKQVVSESLFTKFIKAILALFQQPAPTPMPIPTPPPAPVGDEKLIHALIQVESQGNDNAIGDRNLAHHAYGCLQIRQPVCTDVNDAYGTSYSPNQMLGNRALSIEVFRKYVSLYKCKTDEEKARIWNGGPSAKRPDTRQYIATNGYWSKVKALL